MRYNKKADMSLQKVIGLVLAAIVFLFLFLWTPTVYSKAHDGIETMRFSSQEETCKISSENSNIFNCDMNLCSTDDEKTKWKNYKLYLGEKICPDLKSNEIGVSKDKACTCLQEKIYDSIYERKDLNTLRSLNLNSNPNPVLNYKSSNEFSAGLKNQNNLPDKINRTIHNLGDDNLKYLFDKSRENGFNEYLILALIVQESEGKSDAISSHGAVGLMQLKPCTAKDMGLNINSQNYKIENGKCIDVLTNNQVKEADERFDAKKNIDAGIKYLKWMQEKFALTSIDDVIKSYNIGPTGLKNDPSSVQAIKYLNSILTYKNILVAKEDSTHDDTKESSILNVFDGVSKININTEIFLKDNPYIVNRFGILKTHGKITPQKVVLHHTADGGKGNYKGVESTLIKRDLGIHFVLDRDGKVYMYGNLEDKFWHAGKANGDSIGIEISNTGLGEPYTDAQYETLNKLLPALSLVITDKKTPFVIGHVDVPNNKGKFDPSPAFDWDRIGYSRKNDPKLIASYKDAVIHEKYVGSCYACSSNIG